MENRDFMKGMEAEEVENTGEYLEISQACADRVNLHKFAELNEYLVYLDEENDTLYKVHKQTGERTKVRKSDKSGKIKDFCGAAGRICISLGSKIEIIDIDTGEENEMEVLYEKEDNHVIYGIYNGGSAGAKLLQCNKKYLIYNTTVKKSNAIVYVDFENLDSTLVVDGKNVSIHSQNVFLEGDGLFMVVDNDVNKLFGEGKRILYHYNLITGKLEQLLQIDKNTQTDFKTDGILCGEDFFKYKEYIAGYSVGGYEIDLWYLNIHNIEDKKVRKVSLEDYDEYFLEDEVMRFGKYIILFTEAGAIWKYDIFSEELTMVVEETDCVDSYTKGILNTTTTYSLNVYEDDVNLLNNTLYFRPNSEGTVYKAAMNECCEQAEAL